MKREIFTLLTVALIGASMSLNAQNPESTGTGWETLMPGEPLVLEEDFSGFEFLHSDSIPDAGNSSNNADWTEMGHRDDSTSFVIAMGSKDTIFYDFYHCAFAPNWIAAYAFDDSLTGGTSTMTPGMSRGFVEISREWGSPHFTVSGHLILDLRQLSFVEVVQYSHSSCGGTKRGFTMSMSTDDGVTWDTVRLHCDGYSYSDFDELIEHYNCQKSAHGMMWEDGIYNSNVMLRWTQDARGQAVRLHDLLVFGTITNPSSVEAVYDTEIEINCRHRIIMLSEVADIGIYDLKGSLLKRADNVQNYAVRDIPDCIVLHIVCTHYAVRDIPDGVYIVRAKTSDKITTRRILIK